MSPASSAKASQLRTVARNRQQPVLQRALEQAAAQGMTVVLSAGDGGSAGCDDFQRAAARHPRVGRQRIRFDALNVAVGGTDFDQIDKWTQYWSAKNDPTTFASALGYIPESRGMILARNSASPVAAPRS